jgi:hypothetical protein
MTTGPASMTSRPGPDRPPLRWRSPRGGGPDRTTPAAEHVPVFGRQRDRNLCVIALIDVARSGSVDFQGQLLLRRDLYDLVDRVVDYGGLTIDQHAFTDTGDGVRLLLPLDQVQPTQFVDMFVLGLAAGLREHRRRVNETGRLRLRVALDVGLVEQHLHGWAGSSLVRVARLIECPALRDALCPDGPDLAALVSDALFDLVVRHGHGYLAPACFRPVPVQVKEFDAHGWLVTAAAPGSCSCLLGAA